MLSIINNFPINPIQTIKIVYKTKKNIYEEIVLIFSLHLNNLNLKNLCFILKSMRGKILILPIRTNRTLPLQGF